MIELILSVVAVACLVLAVFGVTVRRVSFGWLGLAVWALVALFEIS